jgi:hypothetical protein
MATEAPREHIPSFHRARGFRLYDTRGRRFLDLFREGALLGHRSPGALTVMKAVLSQGMVSAVPTPWEGRLASVLARLFPAFPRVRLFASRERATRAAANWLDSPGLDPFDPALCAAAGRSGSGGSVLAAFWRPFLPEPQGAGVLLPLLPLTVGGAPSPVCFPAGGAVTRPAAELPGGDTVPGFICAGALRALAAATVPGAGKDFEPSDPRLSAALDGGRNWARVGPYVRALFPAGEYARVHAEFLRAGVLLCPVYPGPSVLPGDCSPGETRLLADLFATVPAGNGAGAPERDAPGAPERDAPGAPGG